MFFVFQSSLRYQPSFTPSVHDRTSDLATTTYSSHERLTPNTLDSRELQEKANEQLHSIKLQQVMLQNRAKQWVQQQQQQQVYFISLTVSTIFTISFPNAALWSSG